MKLNNRYFFVLAIAGFIASSANANQNKTKVESGKNPPQQSQSSSASNPKVSVSPSTSTVQKGGGSTATNNGKDFDCSKNPKLCTGNSGGGVGNQGPGNQGNPGSNGNTGGGTPPTNPGKGNTGSNPGGGSTGGNNGNTFDCTKNPKLCTGNSGGGNGNTGPGNQGNDGTNGNAGGGTCKGKNCGGGNNGGGNNGGGNNGGGNNGGGNNGGGNNGGGNNGGGNNGGGNNGGGNNGGGNNGGGNNGGGNNGGGNNGGGNNGGGNNGGGNNGGGNNGGGNNGGGNNGGGNNGGSDNGGGNNGGSDNGGGDNGGGDNGGGDNGGTPETPQQKEEKRRLKARALPSLYLDFDAFTQITNLTLHDSRKEQPSLVQGAFDKNISTLVYKDYQAGFQVVEYSRFEFGVGGKLSFWFENASRGLARSLWGQVGLIPMTGKEAQTVRYAPTYSAAKSMPEMKSAPMNARDLQAWSLGDALTYSSKGGMIFYSGIGAGILNATRAAIAQGIFTTYIEKVDDSAVLVKFTDNKVDTLSVSNGAAFVTASTSNFKTLATGQSFILNFKDPVGAKAYEDLVRGNLAPVQKMAAEGKNAAVVLFEKASTVQAGKFRNMFFGLPIVANMTFAKGQIHDFTQTQQLTEKTVVDANYGIYMKEYRTRFFNTHTEDTEAFYGSAYRIKDNNGREATRGFFGQVVFTSNDESSSAYSLNQSVNRVVRKTGLRNYLKVNIPTFGNLDFTNVNLKVNFDETQTKLLINSMTQSSTAKMTQVAMAEMSRYSMLPGDIDDVCRDVNVQNNGDFNKYLAECQRVVNYQTQNATAKMAQELRAMDRHLKSGNDKEFTKAYARFGEAMLTNQFTFKLALAMAGAGVQLDYRIEGTDISSYQVSFLSTQQMGVLDINRNFVPDQARASAVGRGKATIDRGVILAPKRPGVNVPTQP